MVSCLFQQITLLATSRFGRWATFLLPLMLVSFTSTSFAEEADDAANEGEVVKQDDAANDSRIKKQLFHGQVIPLVDAFKKRGIRPSGKEHEGQVVLETANGELIPIVADWRGRAFYQDERLRNRPVDLVGYRQDGVPYLQVLMIFTFNKQGEREYMDYWCDICSIPMYEIKPCDCCQADIRLRFQPRKLPSYLDVSETVSRKESPADKNKVVGSEK